MLQIRYYRLSLARFLAGLYIALLTNGVVFRHAHRLADGTIICHAHPYKSQPGTQFPNHTHSRDELIWLDAFTNVLYDAPGPVAQPPLLPVVLLLLSVRSAPYSRCLPVSVHTAFRHRGPPYRV